MRPQKIPGKAAPTWSLKMLNRIRVFPQNLALGMKTHIFSMNRNESKYFSFTLNFLDIRTLIGNLCLKPAGHRQIFLEEI